jgi:hypothetical protein
MLRSTRLVDLFMVKRFGFTYMYTCTADTRNFHAVSVITNRPRRATGKNAKRWTIFRGTSHLTNAIIDLDCLPHLPRRLHYLLAPRSYPASCTSALRLCVNPVMTRPSGRRNKVQLPARERYFQPMLRRQSNERCRTQPSMRAVDHLMREFRDRCLRVLRARARTDNGASS